MSFQVHILGTPFEREWGLAQDTYTLTIKRESFMFYTEGKTVQIKRSIVKHSGLNEKINGERYYFLELGSSSLNGPGKIKLYSSNIQALQESTREFVKQSKKSQQRASTSHKALAPVNSYPRVNCHQTNQSKSGTLGRRETMTQKIKRTLSIPWLPSLKRKSKKTHDLNDVQPVQSPMRERLRLDPAGQDYSEYEDVQCPIASSSACKAPKGSGGLHQIFQAMIIASDEEDTTSEYEYEYYEPSIDPNLKWHQNRNAVTEYADQYFAEIQPGDDERHIKVNNRDVYSIPSDATRKPKNT